MQPILILGAGIAGLVAARELARAGRRVHILEARERIGGRLHTIVDERFAVPVQMGAEFVHGEPEATWKLIREAGLTAYEVPFEHRWRLGRKLRIMPSYEEQLADAMGGLSRVRRDVSFAEYLRTHRAGREHARGRVLATDFVQGFDAADPERVSARSLAAEQESLGDVANERQFRLVEGYGALLEQIVASMAKGRVSLRLRAVAREVRWSKGRVEVRLEPGSAQEAPKARTSKARARASSAAAQGEIVHGSTLLVTLPLGVLQVPPERPGSLLFVPEIPEKREAMGRLASGPIVKVVLRFQEAFWEAREVQRRAGADAELARASFLHDRSAAFPTWWTMHPLRTPILTGWVGGPPALRIAGRSDREVVASAIESLGSVFHMDPVDLRRGLVAAHVGDWVSDPFARGAYSYELVGAGEARSSLAKPIAGTLFFAGEATDTSGQASTVAGAIASGLRAAKEILATRNRGAGPVRESRRGV